MKSTIETDIKDYAIDQLRDGVGVGTLGCELHNDLFNTDYFIIGTYQAKEWLKNGPGVFEAIELIQDWEEEQFGEKYTDCSNPEAVVNMYAFIRGEDLLSESPTLRSAWNRELTEEDIADIIEEIS